jgi:hypothetical protein
MVLPYKKKEARRSGSDLGEPVSVSSLAIDTPSDLNLFTQWGALLLRAGTQITPDFIRRLEERRISTVYARASQKNIGALTSKPAPKVVDEVEIDKQPSIAIDGTDSMFAINEMINAKSSNEDTVYQNKRTDARYLCNEVLILGSLSSGGAFTPICDAWGVDISNQGVGLITEQSIDAGEKLVLRLYSQPRRSQLFVRVRIVRCDHLIGSVYALGVIFLFAPSRI